MDHDVDHHHDYYDLNLSSSKVFFYHSLQKIPSLRLTPQKQKNDTTTKIRLCFRFWCLLQKGWTKIPRLTMKIFKKKYLLNSSRITQERDATWCEFSLLSILFIGVPKINTISGTFSFEAKTLVCSYLPRSITKTWAYSPFLLTQLVATIF